MRAGVHRRHGYVAPLPAARPAARCRWPDGRGVDGSPAAARPRPRGVHELHPLDLRPAVVAQHRPARVVADRRPLAEVDVLDRRALPTLPACARARPPVLVALALIDRQAGQPGVCAPATDAVLRETHSTNPDQRSAFIRILFSPIAASPSPP